MWGPQAASLNSGELAVAHFLMCNFRKADMYKRFVQNPRLRNSLRNGNNYLIVSRIRDSSALGVLHKHRVPEGNQKGTQG